VIILARTPALDLLWPTLFTENTAVIRQGGTQEVQELFARIREKVSVNGSEKEISLLIFQLLQELSAAKKEKHLHPALEKALAFIRSRGYGGISREETAKAAGVSNRQLNILFQKFLNISPGAFLIQRRIAFAKELLAAGKLPVNEIARMSGFASTEFFIRAFRKHTGVTPGSWNHKLQ
jgi:AraC-like DNA-binding protein